MIFALLACAIGALLAHWAVRIAVLLPGAAAPARVAASGSLLLILIGATGAFTFGVQVLLMAHLPSLWWLLLTTPCTFGVIAVAVIWLIQRIVHSSRIRDADTRNDI